MVFPSDEDVYELDLYQLTIAAFMYLSLTCSVLAAFAAILVKQWLDRYLRDEGGSLIKRCGDRQRKCDKFDNWKLRLVVESLSVLLHASTFLFASGLLFRAKSVYIAFFVVWLILPAAFLYTWTTIRGVWSDAYPYRTPVSNTLRSLWRFWCRSSGS